MNGKHFHEEWSFRVDFTKDGKTVKTIRYVEDCGRPFETEEQARAKMHELSGYFSAYMAKNAADREYDAFTVYSPVPRIVTEWEDATENEENRR